MFLIKKTCIAVSFRQLQVRPIPMVEFWSKSNPPQKPTSEETILHWDASRRKNVSLSETHLCLDR